MRLVTEKDLIERKLDIPIQVIGFLYKTKWIIVQIDLMIHRNIVDS